MAAATEATFETLERNLKVSGTELVDRVKVWIRGNRKASLTRPALAWGFSLATKQPNLAASGGGRLLNASLVTQRSSSPSRH